MRATATALLALTACTADPTPEAVVWIAPADEAAVFERFANSLDDDRVVVLERRDPARSLRRPLGLRVALTQDDDLCAECYVLDRVDATWVEVRAGGRLGRLFAVSHVHELLGYRFPHPHHTVAPATLALPEDDPAFGVLHAPEVARRGLHLHTLHPIEGLFDTWVPGADHAANATRIFDWVIRHRGNHVQWVALEDVLLDGGTAAAWVDHTRTLLDEAHARGLSVGLGVQLFGSGNLQQAFDLIDRGRDVAAWRTEMGPRLDLLTDDLDLDVFNLSFGEFSAEDEQSFLAAFELAYDEIVAREPSAEVTTTIHVGDDLQVPIPGSGCDPGEDPDCETMIYYFLATYADRPITPWIHTVMFYGLFEDAGGAYHHEAFDEHRDFLLQALQEGEPVGYFPESAYWIAFDTSVPQSLPLYLRTRWTDLDRLAAFAETEGVPGLDDHVLFSSGWEWGYWLTDAMVLRNTWSLPDDRCDPVRAMYAGLGDVDGRAADALCAVGDLQHRWLLEERLTPFVVGYDAPMELGYATGTLAQPRRLLPAQIVAADEALRDDLTGRVLPGLRAYRDGLADALDGLGPAEDETRWIAEVRDGLEIGWLRAEHAADLVEAALAGPEAAAPLLERVAARLIDAQAIVDRRHADLHDPDPSRLLAPGDNPTLYDFGYLLRADTLCFWHRELLQTRNALRQAEAARDGEELTGIEPVPACFLETTGR